MGVATTATDRGAGRWRMPWHHDGSPAARPVNVATGIPYRGLNILALWAAAENAGHAQDQSPIDAHEFPYIAGQPPEVEALYRQVRESWSGEVHRA